MYYSGKISYEQNFLFLELIWSIAFSDFFLIGMLSKSLGLTLAVMYFPK